MTKKIEFALLLEDNSVEMTIEQNPAEQTAGIWIKEKEGNKAISFEIDQAEAKEIVQALTETFNLNAL